MVVVVVVEKLIVTIKLIVIILDFMLHQKISKDLQSERANKLKISSN